jgi:hypothetical protein
MAHLFVSFRADGKSEGNSNGKSGTKALQAGNLRGLPLAPVLQIGIS